MPLEMVNKIIEKVNKVLGIFEGKIINNTFDAIFRTITKI